LGYPELQQLIQNAEQLHNEKQNLLESKKIRIISGGGGRKPNTRTNNFNLGLSEAHHVSAAWHPV